MQLHAMQKLWELFSDDECQASPTKSPSVEPTSQLYACLSTIALRGVESAIAMRLLGNIQGRELLILLDLGSSSTFVNAIVGATLFGATTLPQPLIVQVANDAQLHYTSQLPNAQWQIHGVHFCSNLKILHLDHFDMVLDYDWLHQLSLMEIH
jgi:hypothetical protein